MSFVSQITSQWFIAQTDQYHVISQPGNNAQGELRLRDVYSFKALKASNSLLQYTQWPTGPLAQDKNKRMLEKSLSQSLAHSGKSQFFCPSKPGVN